MPKARLTWAPSKRPATAAELVIYPLLGLLALTSALSMVLGAV